MMRRSICCCLLICFMQNSFAWSWRDLFQTPDQQAAQLMQDKQYQKAEQTFQNKQWKGVAAYRDKNFNHAAKQFSDNRSATGWYNKGNALAQSRQLPEAIKAYEKALKLNPHMKDAEYNLKLVKKLQKQQQQKQKNQKQNKNKKNNQDKQSKSNKQNQQQKQNKKNKPNKKNQQQNSKEKQDQKNQQKSKNQQQNRKDKQNQQDKKNKKNQLPQSAKQTASQNKPTRTTTAQQLKTPSALKQWLQKIPDNPGGLLKQKFLRDYYRYTQ